MKNEIKKFGKLKLNKESLSMLKGGALPASAGGIQAKSKTKGKGKKRCCLRF